MIQIDMQMPEKCGDCIFCDDNCSCVASDYNGTGINVGCAYRTGRRDIRCPLKEQEEKKWINVNDRLPDEKGSYLVAYKAFQYTLIGVKRFAKNLHLVDKYYFPKEHRPGWYEYDDEYGYFERTDVTHWMPLPDAPE